MMKAERWRELGEKGGCVDLSARAKWRLTGGDRVRYLNGQVTQDIRKAQPAQALRACVTDAKGRLFGDVFVRASADAKSLLLDAEAALRETLGARLERYIVADDVELDDVTEAWRLLHVFGPSATPIPDGAAISCRVGVAGYDLWLPAEAEAPQSSVTPEEWEKLRILRGIANYPNELHEGVFPPEAGLESETMDYAKGCYIGQEVLSRIRSTGKMPRTLVKWMTTNASASLESGASVTAPDSGSVLGQVTSVTTHPLSGHLCGLAYVKQGALPADSQLLVGDQLASILPLNQDFPTS